MSDEQPNFKLSTDRSTAVSTTVEWLPMDDAPLGVKIQVLNLGCVGTHTVLSEAERHNWLGYQLMPLIPQWLKEEIANRSPRPRNRS